MKKDKLEISFEKIRREFDNKYVIPDVHYEFVMEVLKLIRAGEKEFEGVMLGFDEQLEELEIYIVHLMNIGSADKEQVEIILREIFAIKSIASAFVIHIMKCCFRNKSSKKCVECWDQKEKVHA